MKLTREARRPLTAVLGVVMLALLVVTVPPAASGAGYTPARAQREKPVAGRSQPPGPARAQAAARPFRGAAPVWPKPAVADVDLPPVHVDGPPAHGTATPPRGTAVRAGGLPVWVQSEAPPAGRSAGMAAPGRVRVEVFDRTAARSAGSDGLLLRLSTVDSTGPVRVTVDYSAFRWAYGADWASRLRLVELPGCPAPAPAGANCAPSPVPTRNDLAAGTASATVTARPTGTLVALSPGPSGPAGDYSATALTPSGTWSAGGNSGDFSWSYPMRMPPSLGGPAPSVGLFYSSSSVDGRMAASNNQPSLIGEGFDSSPGAVMRRYVPCGADRTAGANNTENTGDQCWLAENATLWTSGRGGELIEDGANPNRWHLRGDDGTLVERRTGAANGALDGEWWVVTTTDGTQYWFGGTPASNSTLLVPVYGNHPGEPCHQATFVASSCTQAYQWNLDHVVDRHGNTMTYVYAKETNRYARAMNPADLAVYDRSSHLVRIEYGTRADRAETAPMQVRFDTADRCLADCGAHDAAHWPDTPYDQECTVAPCHIWAPTFWTTRRLVAVSTRVGDRDVERWSLTQSFPDPGDGTRAGLWLERISHTGLAGPTTTVPDVTFAGVQLPNRVDTIDHSPAMNWWRIKTITTETGGKIDVTYSGPDCVAGTRVPDVHALQDNRLRCYPVKWTPLGNPGPVTDFFHRYVVTDVVEADQTGGAPRTRTHYDYLGDPAWHYNDDTGLVPVETDKTWSNWRGYGAVRTVKGDPGEQTQSETRYFRGMHGDHLPIGTRSVRLPAIAVGAVPAVDDEDVFAGMTRETITYNGPGGPEVSASVSEPWRSPPTASRTRNGITVHARHVQIGASHTRTALDKGRAPRTTTTRTVFDDTYGMVVSVEDRGDDALTGDETCTLTDYARSPDAWLVAAVSRVRVFAVDCARAGAGGLTDDDVTGDQRTSYDGKAYGVAPATGDVTRTEALKAYHDGNPTYVTTATSEYDPYGRVVKTTDARGLVTTTGYLPAAGGPVTASTRTTDGTWRTTTTTDPAWGLPTSTVDANGRRTELAYDGLGRLVSVWKPGRDRTTQSPNFLYGYQIRDTTAVAVTSRALTPGGGYATTYTLYDSLLRVRQTQAPDAAGGPHAVVTDTYYDSVGRPARTTGAYLSTAPPGTDLFVPTAVVPTRTVTAYDGAGRTTASVFTVDAPPGGSPGGTERWRTTTAYGGDRADVTPPAGGTAVSTVVDALGRTTELRQYHAGVAPGGDDPAGFDRTGYRYNRKGQLAQITDAAGNAWTYRYDLMGRQVRVDDPDRGGTVSVFTDAGDVASTTDARGTTLAFTVDRMGRRTGAYAGSVAPANRLAGWDYDTLGDGSTVAGQLVRTTRYLGPAAYVEETTGFTADYQPTTVTYRIPDGQTGLAGTYTYLYTYHEDGSPKTTRMPALGDLKQETLTYGYDALGRPTTLDSAYGTSPRTGLAGATGYTSFGELGAYTLRNDGGNAVGVARTYETDTRRLAQISTVKQTAPTTVADVRYGYDPAGNVARIADLTSRDHQCLRTDHLRRLTEAWTPASGDCAAAPGAAGLGGPAPYWQSYRYDLQGNRASVVEHATPSGDRTTRYTASGGSHLVTTRTTTDDTGTTTAGDTYDPMGNMLTRPAGPAGTQTMTWDVEGHLATSTDTTGTTGYVYDADGARLIRRDPGGRTLYLPGQELRYTEGSGTKTAVRYYAHAGHDVAVRSAAGLTWLSGDAQGTAQISVTALTQAVSIRRQAPFGAARGGAGPWPSTMDRGFLGGTTDNTGLVHLGAREYDSGTGRFISVDPVFDSANPQQFNGYAYSGNNPATFSDPDGRCYGREEGDFCPGNTAGRWAPPKAAPAQPSPPPCLLRNPTNGQCLWVAGTPRPKQIRKGNLTNRSDEIALTSAARSGGTCELRTYQIYCYNVRTLHDRGGFAREICAYAGNLINDNSDAIHCGEDGELSVTVPEDRPMTIGDVVVYDGSKERFEGRLREERDTRKQMWAQGASAGYMNDYAPDLERHEAAHADQWANYSHWSGFVVDFGLASARSALACGRPDRCNAFELRANAYRGGYLAPPPLGNLPPRERATGR